MNQLISGVVFELHREFEKWYKQIRCNSFVPIQVTGSPLDLPIQKESSETPVVTEEHPWESNKLTIKCIHIEFTDGTEIRNRGTNLLGAIELLRKLTL